MPATAAERSFAQHYKVPLPRNQPQLQQTRYPQQGYPGDNTQSVYATSCPPGGSSGYPQPGYSESATTGQQGYGTGTYPHPGTQSGHRQYAPEVHGSGQMSVVAEARSRDGAGTHQLGITRNAGPEVEPASRTAHQQSTGTEQHWVWSADNTSRRDTNSRRQTSQQNNPHIVKPAVLNPEAVGKLFAVNNALLLLLARLMGQYRFARWRLFSVIICNAASGQAGGRLPGSWAVGRLTLHGGPVRLRSVGATPSFNL